MLHELATGGKCRQIIRMSENAFMILCQKLESDGGLRSTQRMTIEEQVARFLHIIGNDFRNRFVSWFYYQSGSATSVHFHRVLNAIISLEDQYLIQPTGDTVQKQIQEKRRFYPFFKDCIGAIDGTHIRVKVPSKDAPRYRGRKGYPTINVLAACTFDLKFTYVLSGWEGTTSDSRVLKDTLTREDKLNTPDGKFYLVDGGLPLKSTLIAPYRGVRAFGVLKRRFPIIRSTTEPFYSYETQSQIFLACCILHNYLLEVDYDRELEDEVAQEVLNATQDVEDHAPNAMDDRGEQIRESIILLGLWKLTVIQFLYENKLAMSKKDGTSTRFHWTTPMDTAFLQAMITKKDNGNRIDGTFTPQAYTNMVEELGKAFGMDLTKDHLKNRLKTLKDHFSKFYDVLKGNSMNDFSWDPSTKLLGAEEEVWEKLIKKSPEAAKWRDKPILHYHEMLELFAKDRATETPDSQAKYPSFSKSKKRKLEKDDEFTTTLMSSINNVADAIGKSTKDLCKVMEGSRACVYSEEEIYKELEIMGIVSEEEIFDVYLFLVERPEKARALFGCPLNKRVNMLRRMMGA
ncbi:uncharacterized protein LOC143531898 [Bidens hawaiensis]|uniref:uncharacterized protein LOC143531898 n=1 Tax=Bidens hawaiensis TaxID=980011 RepID=UPI00404937B9